MRITQLPTEVSPLFEVKEETVANDGGNKRSSAEDYTVYRVKTFSDGKESFRKSKVFAPDVEVYRKKTFEA